MIRFLSQAWSFIKLLAFFVKNFFTRKKNNYPWADFISVLIKIINRGRNMEHKERIEKEKKYHASIKEMRGEANLSPIVKKCIENNEQDFPQEISKFCKDIKEKVEKYKKEVLKVSADISTNKEKREERIKKSRFKKEKIRNRLDELRLLDAELSCGPSITHFNDAKLKSVCQYFVNQKIFSTYLERAELINDLKEILKNEAVTPGYAHYCKISDLELKDSLELENIKHGEEIKSINLRHEKFIEDEHNPLKKRFEEIKEEQRKNNEKIDKLEKNLVENDKKHQAEMDIRNNNELEHAKTKKELSETKKDLNKLKEDFATLKKEKATAENNASRMEIKFNKFKKEQEEKNERTEAAFMKLCEQFNSSQQSNTTTKSFGSFFG